MSRKSEEFFVSACRIYSLGTGNISMWTCGILHKGNSLRLITCAWYSWEIEFNVSLDVFDITCRTVKE
jgi:hypothetical protein